MAISLTPRQRAVRNVMRKEFTDFLDTFSKPTPKWPGATDGELIDSLAVALMELGKRRGMGTAFLQTFVYELQDRINQNLKD